VITATDFFCGAGGSSTGLVEAGFEVRHAANHWARAIETHQTNHPQTEHSIDDLQEAHPSWYPRTDVAWFSPSCTSHSLAKGRKRKGASQLDLWGESVLTPDEIRSRATMREVVEFTAYHQYEAVIVENVVDIRYWEYYDQWLTAMRNLGYEHRICYFNSQFFGVPQSRDRFYAVFWKRGNKAPDLDFRPLANCSKHGTVKAIQSFKKSDFPWGRYGTRRQYVYRCPQCGEEIKPGHTAAASIIDWSLECPRIGDREKPLKPRTMERVLAGLKKFGGHVLDLGHLHAEHPGKVSSLDGVLHTITSQQTLALVPPFLTSQHDGRNPLRTVDDPLWCVTSMNNEQQLCVPPFMTVMKNSAKDGYNQPSIGVDEPLTTVVASASQHGLVMPPFLAELRQNSTVRNVDEPLSTITSTGAHHALIMAYYGNQPTYARTSEPLPTLTTVDRHALITPEEMLPDCGFRMLVPQELKLAMSFPQSYIITGNKSEQVKQIGNAVTPEVAKWLGRQVMESLQ
jgi:DNA (cytosine-5)-methyltransferase 1